MNTSAKNWKLGFSTKIDSRERFEECRDAGVDVIEISMDEAPLRELDWHETARLAAETGVGIWSIHLPFRGITPLDPAALSAEVRAHTLACFTEFMQHAAEAGTRVAVVHPSLEPTAPAERAERIEYSKESLARLADAAAACGMVVAVEDLPRTCLANTAEELFELLSADARLRVTFDVNHLLYGTHERFVELLGEKIVTTHISDYDFKNERHWLPGEGKIDWLRLTALLENAGYAGPWLYELSLDAPDTIRRPRPLTLADLRENFDTIASGRAPAPFGTPDEALCLAKAYLK